MSLYSAVKGEQEKISWPIYKNDFLSGQRTFSVKGRRIIFTAVHNFTVSIALAFFSIRRLCV